LDGKQGEGEKELREKRRWSQSAVPFTDIRLEQSPNLKWTTKMKIAKGKSLIPAERVERAIFLIHGQKVILDKDLAILYQVATRDLNKAVNRNLDRFPGDFMFQLTKEEFSNLKFHFGTSSWGDTRKLPRAFTEQG
jgi:hypothetical protein